MDRFYPMKKILLIISFLLSILLLIGCSNTHVDQSQAIQHHFKNPPQSYLPTVYWFWNGEIEYDKIKWQLEEMKQSNTVGSVCILAWEGLAVEYLSDEWFDKVKYACQIAEALGLEIWLYDEIRWPSGHAGGKVLESNPDYKAKCLTAKEQRFTGEQRISIEIASEPVAIIAGKLNDNGIEESSLIDVSSFCDGKLFAWNVPNGDWLITIYSVEHCSFKPTFSDQEYVDLLDPNATQKFIELTHEEYFKRMPDYFGSVIKAIITDEPGCYCNLKAFMISPETIPWTPLFFDAFASRKNYDLKKYLPAIWHDIGEKTAQIRIDFYEVVADLLQQSYLKPLHDWCENHGIKLNIQPAHEETMKYSTILHGDYFKAMEYSHLPGADEVYSWDKKAITAKIAASAARSFGNQDVYCEVFAAYGWDVTLEQMKAVTDWLFARGVNRLMLSSFYFSMDGDWQFEIPPSLFYQNTLWPYLPNYTDYVQRLSYLLSGGRNVAPIAMFYPNKSVQAALSPLDETMVDQIDNSFNHLSNFLLNHQLDFDYLHERILIDKIKVLGKDKTVLRLNHNDFWIDYELLLLPLAQIIDAAALQQAKNFYDRGGTLIAYGSLPRRSVDGADLTSTINQIWRNPSSPNSNAKGGKAFFVKSDLDSILAIIESCLIPDIRLEPRHDNISFIHKIKNDLDIYFISNSDSVPVNTEISFSQNAIPQIWNPENGSINPAKQFRQEHDRTILPVQLDRFGSLLVVFDHSKKEIPRVMATNMKIENIEMRDDSIFVDAIAIAAGKNYVRLKWQEKVFEKQFVASAPAKFELSDTWKFKPKDDSFPEEIRSAGTWTEQQTIAQPNGSTIAHAHPYFSGTGVYSQKFILEQSLFDSNRKFILDPGEIKEIIEVWLNGKKIGERCWHPMTSDITNELRAGENEIELRITNTPANSYMLRTEQYRFGETWGKVLPSGLLENVRIIMYERFQLSFAIE